MKHDLPPGCAGVLALGGSFLVACGGRGLFRFDPTEKPGGTDRRTEFLPPPHSAFPTGLCHFSRASWPGDDVAAGAAEQAQLFFCGWVTGRVALIEVNPDSEGFSVVWHYRGDARSPVSLCQRVSPELVLIFMEGRSGAVRVTEDRSMEIGTPCACRGSWPGRWGRVRAR